MEKTTSIRLPQDLLNQADRVAAQLSKTNLPDFGGQVTRSGAINVTMGGDVGALFAALAKAQGQMGAAKKGAANPHFKSKFADLASVLEAILPPLNANGLALVQMPGHSEDKVTQTTMITHSSGGWMCSKAATALGRKNDAQAVGSAITYLRRYCAQAALALPAVDDDGEAAMGRGNSRPAPAKPKPAPPAVQRSQYSGHIACNNHCAGQQDADIRHLGVIRHFLHIHLHQLLIDLIQPRRNIRHLDLFIAGRGPFAAHRQRNIISGVITRIISS